MSRLIESRENFLWSKGQPPSELPVLVHAFVEGDPSSALRDSLVIKRRCWNRFRAELEKHPVLLEVPGTSQPLWNDFGTPSRRRYEFRVVDAPTSRDLARYQTSGHGVFQSLVRGLPQPKPAMGFFRGLIFLSRSYPWIYSSYLQRMRSLKESASVEDWCERNEIHLECERETRARAEFETRPEEYIPGMSVLPRELLGVLREWLGPEQPRAGVSEASARVREWEEAGTGAAGWPPTPQPGGWPIML